jgi:Uma2 family endonuclease
MSVMWTPERTRISAERFDKMIAAGVLTKYDRVELIEGDMINEPGINPPHSAVTARLNELLVLSVGRSVTVSPCGSVRLGDFSVPQPDLMLLKRREDFYFGRRPTASEVLLLIEVSDSSFAYDQSTKRALYARYGVEEYWVVDVQGERVFVYGEPAGEGYARVVECTGADIVSPRAEPAVKIQVGTLFPGGH